MSLATASFADELAAYGRRIETVLDELLSPVDGRTARLVEAMRYAALGGGKRLRGYLIKASADLFEVAPEASLRAGAALEMVHAYSLLHDDLPAMDDARLRRGKPACHLAFDEATAILAGDTLLTLAFEVLSDPLTHADAAVRLELVRALSAGAGLHGMCGGQMVDLLGERAPLSAEELFTMERMKTGALIRYACEAGAILAGAPDAARVSLRAYGADIGLAFQIQDDIIDVAGDAALAGKDLGRDEGAGKTTFVAVYGLEGARQELIKLRISARSHLERFGARAEPLRRVVDFIIDRQH